jgi:hypothetical protein
MESTAITTRELRASREDRFWGVNLAVGCRGGEKNQTVLLLALRRRDGRQSFFRDRLDADWQFRQPQDMNNFPFEEPERPIAFSQGRCNVQTYANIH